MAIAKIVPSKRLAALQLDFPDSHSWCPPRRSDDRPPVFLASQLVLGDVNLSYLNASYRQPGDKVQVTLTGTFKSESWAASNPCNYDWIRKYDTKQILHMTKTLTIKFPSISASKLLPSYRLGYEFQACTKETPDIKFGSPDSASHEDSSLDHVPIRYSCSWSIPSSSTTRFALPGRLRPDEHGYLEVSINYQLTAVLLRKNGSESIAQISRPIIIFNDSHGIRPPTCITDYPDEYCSFTAAKIHSSSMARNFFTKISRHQNTSPPDLFVSATESHPLVFYRSFQHATTLVPIELTLLDSQYNDHNLSYNNVKITWQLQPSHFSTLDGFRKIPTREHLQKKTNKVVNKTVQESPNTYTCQVGHWRSSTPTKHMLQYDSTAAMSLSEERSPTSLTETLGSDDSPQKVAYIDSSCKPSSTSSDTSLNTSNNYLRYASTSPPNILHVSSEAGPPPKSARTTSVSLPISIPLSTCKLPTSTTSYMVIRYALSIQIHMRLNIMSTNPGKPHDREDSNRRTSSWAAEAHLDIPIQLVYASDDDNDGNNNETLHNVSNDDEVEAKRGIEAATHNRNNQSSEGIGTSSGSAGNRRSISAQQHRQDQRERLPSYGESIGLGHTLVSWPVTAVRC